MVRSIDIHDIPVAEWGELPKSLIGQVVDVEILCVHPFGVGVRVVAADSYGHVNAPHVTDGLFTVEEASKEIGSQQKAVVLAAPVGWQPTLSLRQSEIPS